MVRPLPLNRDIFVDGYRGVLYHKAQKPEQVATSDGGLGDVTFGLIQKTRRDPRVVRLALRLLCDSF